MITNRRMRPSTAFQQRARELRKNSTPAEQRLWLRLKGRQHPLGTFILDFYCAQMRLAVELDGGVHQGQAEADAQRSQALERSGIHLIRFPNAAVKDDIEGVLAAILAACGEAPFFPPAGERAGE
jgi:very-short-patch-repair endonuclease